jgi:hypothetical protein
MQLVLLSACLNGPCARAADPTMPVEAPGGGTARSDSHTTTAPGRDGRRHALKQPLEDRVRLLARELHLDGTQQASVMRILEGQRMEVARVWNDTSLPAARRVSATQAIGERTADQIRALLNDEQKKKFSAPRQPRAPAEEAPAASVEDWMPAARSP